MSYAYRRRSPAELKKIAGQILNRFPNRQIGEFAIDIDGILEDLGLEIIFRPNLGFPSVAGYIARDPRYIVLSELCLVYLPYGRFTLAEEVCHKILEWNLWKSGNIPSGAHAHELTEKQYREIEENARSLAAEILEPEAIFRQRYQHHKGQLSGKGVKGDPLIKAIARATSEDFIVSMYAVAYRARKLKLITPNEHRRNFPILM